MRRRKTERLLLSLSTVLLLGLCSCSSVEPASDLSPVIAPTAAEPAMRLTFRTCYEKATDGAEPMQLDQQTVFVAREELLDNRHVARAWAEEDATGDYAIQIEFTAEGRERFAQVTAGLVDQRLAILLDGELIVAPMVRVPITGGRAMIAGNYTKEQAQRIAEGITTR